MQYTAQRVDLKRHEGKFSKQSTMKFVFVLALTVGVAGCSSKPLAVIPYEQDFSGALGPEWHSPSRAWKTVNGRLFSPGTHNVPLWLSAPLPKNVRVSFTAESKSEAVDLKFEIFADGEHHASGYVVILAGWNNSKSIIARLDEHGPEFTPTQIAALKSEVHKDRDAAAKKYREQRAIVAKYERQQPGRIYRFRFEKQDHDLRFFVDDMLYLEFFDPAPLFGAKHDRLAFNNWASEVYFDDLKIEPL